MKSAPDEFFLLWVHFSEFGSDFDHFSLFCFISEFVILSPLFRWSHERAPQRVSLAPEVANTVSQVRTGVNLLSLIGVISCVSVCPRQSAELIDAD